MVNVGEKPDTERVAVARGEVHMRPETLRLIVENGLPKGDVLTTAQVAGVMAAKQIANLIPLCYPLLLTKIDVTFEVDSHRRQRCRVDDLRYGESRRKDHAHHGHPPC